MGHLNPTVAIVALSLLGLIGQVMFFRIDSYPEDQSHALLGLIVILTGILVIGSRRGERT